MKIPPQARFNVGIVGKNEKNRFSYDLLTPWNLISGFSFFPGKKNCETILDIIFGTKFLENKKVSTKFCPPPSPSNNAVMMMKSGLGDD